MNMADSSQLKYEKALEYEIFVKGEYSFSIEKIKNAKCIFDIWWHVWFFSKWSRIYNKDVEIHYFEPVKDSYNKALKAFEDDRKVILNNFWIASYTGGWMLLYNSEKTMQSSKYLSFLNPKWIGINVSFVTLRNYLDLKNILKIDVLKMDIEWMEIEVLSSFSDYEWSKIENLIVEVHLFDDKKRCYWNQIFFDIKNKFKVVRIIGSWYRDEIFLLYASKSVL